MTSSDPLLAQMPDFGVRQLFAAELDGRDPGINTANFAAGVGPLPQDT